MVFSSILSQARLYLFVQVQHSSLLNCCMMSLGCSVLFLSPNRAKALAVSNIKRHDYCLCLEVPLKNSLVIWRSSNCQCRNPLLGSVRRESGLTREWTQRLYHLPIQNDRSETLFYAVFYQVSIWSLLVSFSVIQSCTNIAVQPQLHTPPNPSLNHPIRRHKSIETRTSRCRHSRKAQ